MKKKYIKKYMPIAILLTKLMELGPGFFQFEILCLQRLFHLPPFFFFLITFKILK